MPRPTSSSGTALAFFLLTLTLSAFCNLNASAQAPTWSIALKDTAGNNIDPGQWIHDPQLKVFVQGAPFDAQFIDIDDDPAFSDPTTWDFTHPSGPPLIRTFEAPSLGDVLGAVAFSPDGQTIAAGSPFSGNVIFWNVETARKIDEINVSAWPHLGNIAFLNGGSTFMSWPSDDRNTHIFFYDYPFDGITSRFPKTSINLVNSPLYTCVPSPDGSKLLLSLNIEDSLNPPERKNILRLYDAATHDILKTYDGAGLIEPIYMMAFNGDGKQFVTISGDGIIRLWDTDSGRILKEYSNSYPDVASVAFSPNGKTILLGRVDYYRNDIAQIVDVASGEAIHTLEGHTDTIFSVAYSPDGLEVVTSSLDNTARLWDTQTGQLLEYCKGHTEYIRDLAFAPDGLSFATASYDSTVKLWRGRPKYDYSIKNTADGPRTLYVRLRDGAGHSETASFNFNLNLTTAKADWTIILQDPEGDGRPEGNWINRSQMQVVVQGATLDTEEADFALDPDFTDPITQPLETTSFSTVRTINHPVWDYNGKEMSADWTKLANFDALRFKICDFSNNSTLLRETPVESAFRMVSFSPDATRLIVGLVGKSQLWNTVSGEKIDDDYLGTITVAAWSPDGTKVIFAGAGYDVKLVDAQTKELLHTFTGHTYTVSSLAFSPDGKLALSGGQDGRVMLWDTQTGDLVRSITGNSVSAVAFSPDGTSYMEGGNSSGVHMYDVQSGEWIQTFAPHFNIVRSIRCSPDGTKVLTHAGIALDVWDATTGKCLGSSADFNDGYFPITLSHDGTMFFNGTDKLLSALQHYPVSFDGLADGAYTLHVRLRNHLGLNQINSIPLNLDSIPPTKPGTPLVGSGPVPGGQIEFIWEPSTDNASGVNAYDYQVGTAPGAVDVEEGRIGATGPIILSVPYGVPVYCRVRAIDKAGSVSEWSDASLPSIVTTQPNIPGVVLNPPHPRAIDDVTARLVSTLPYTRYKTEWYLMPIPVQDNKPTFVGNTLKSSFLTKGQYWQCKIAVQIPDGDFKYQYSKTFMVRNTPPSQPIVELSPRPASAGQPLAVSLVQASVDPDGDTIVYAIEWSQSTDGGQSWTHRTDLSGLAEIPGSEIKEEDRWRVRYIPYEIEVGIESVQGLPGRDQVVVGTSQPPDFAFTDFQMQNVNGSVALSAQWTTGDPENTPVTVDLYYYDERYTTLTPLQMGIPASQQFFSDILLLPRNAPLRLYAIATDAAGSSTQAFSASLILESAAHAAWMLYE